MWRFPKSWGYPKIMLFFDLSWNKPSSYWGIPHFTETFMSFCQQRHVGYNINPTIFIDVYVYIYTYIYIYIDCLNILIYIYIHTSIYRRSVHTFHSNNDLTLRGIFTRSWFGARRGAFRWRRSRRNWRNWAEFRRKNAMASVEDIGIDVYRKTIGKP